MKRSIGKKKKLEVEFYKMDITSQCPLVACRFDECYCKNMNSQKIVNVVHYCMRNYEACEIYKAKTALKDLHGLPSVDVGGLAAD
ncbi:MAG: hypothetical protein SWE60_18810 [Thermodesulfobacteriota bacterium]|nr:hypothetical protein [Thermodesulfobacteriota bacterium]